MARRSITEYERELRRADHALIITIIIVGAAFVLLMYVILTVR